MKLKTLLFLPLAALLMAAAAKAPPVVFEPPERKSAVSIELGQELTIVLPTTDADHVWQIVANDSRYLRESVKLAPRTGGPTAGASATFQTSRGGHTRLSFVYVNAKITGEDIPADIRDIAVTINRKF